MNAFVSCRFDEFKEYFYSHDKKGQLEILNGYFSYNVLNILTGRRYCEYLANLLLEKTGISVGVNTYNELVDEIEKFLSSKEMKLYPSWQRNWMAFVIKRLRKFK